MTYTSSAFSLFFPLLLKFCFFANVQGEFELSASFFMLLCYGTFFSNTTEKWVVLVFDCEIAVVHTGPVFPYTFPPVFPYTFSIIFSSASWSFVFLLMCRVNLNFLRAFFCCCASGTFFSDANENWVVLVLFCEIAVVHTSPVPVWESFRFHWGIAVQAEVSFRTALAKKWKKRIFLDRFLDLSFPDWNLGYI